MGPVITLSPARYERVRHAVNAMRARALENLECSEGVIMESACRDDVTEWELLLDELDQAAGRAI